MYRATLRLGQLAGVAVSTGWMAGIRGKAAALVEASGFTGRVRELLKTAPAVPADETPARTAGGTRCLHLACTRYLTCMHTGDRSADAIDSGEVLPGYQGIIVRDGYARYGHLTSALHAWCAVHLLRDLKGLYDFEPGKQDWAARLASLLIEARDAAAAARPAGEPVLDAAVLDDLLTRYRALATAGLAASLYRRTATAKDARRLARRFLGYEDTILRFATRPQPGLSPASARGLFQVEVASGRIRRQPGELAGPGATESPPSTTVAGSPVGRAPLAADRTISVSGRRGVGTLGEAQSLPCSSGSVGPAAMAAYSIPASNRLTGQVRAQASASQARWQARGRCRCSARRPAGQGTRTRPDGGGPHRTVAGSRWGAQGSGCA